MKKILYLFVIALSFAACSGEEQPVVGNQNDTSNSGNNANNGNGSGNGGQQTEIICPESVRAGEEGLIQWDGFKEGDALCLSSKGGEDIQLEIKAMTSSGLTFYVPETVPAGKYMLVLVRDSRKELGEIEILEMSCPVSAVSVPSAVTCGDVLEITGLGFKEGCVIVLKDAENNEYEFDAQLTDLGVVVTVPEDMPAGVYDVYLVQSGKTWPLGTGLQVRELPREEVIKELVGLRYIYPYDGEIMSMTSWTVSAGEPTTLEVASYTIEAGVETKDSYDNYVSYDQVNFVLDHDGMEISNDIEMSYVRSDEGTVEKTDVVLFGKTVPTEVLWTYDEEGRLVDIASEKGSFSSMEYDEAGNLFRFHAMNFGYSDTSLLNAAYAHDAVWGYMAVMSAHKDPFIYIPYMLGWQKVAQQVQLPSSVYLPDPVDYTGSTLIEHPFAYEFDEDGYVMKMSWTIEGNSHWIEYIYKGL